MEDYKEKILKEFVDETHIDPFYFMSLVIDFMTGHLDTLGRAASSTILLMDSRGKRSASMYITQKEIKIKKEP